MLPALLAAQFAQKHTRNISIWVGLSSSATNTLSFYTDYCCYMSETAGGVDKQTEIKNILDL